MGKALGEKRPSPRSICYGAVKAALIHLRRLLAEELGEYNVTVLVSEDAKNIAGQSVNVDSGVVTV